MRVLVTNDDGVEAAGIHALAAALCGDGHDAVVAAPDTHRSGSGAATGLIRPDQRVDATRVELPGCEGVPAYAVDGPPGLCVIAGRLGAFGEPPDLVVSGINAGLNTGRAILHSGTVGAALTAQNFGCSGLAVSAEVSDPWYWDTAARIAIDVLGRLADAPPRTVLNLNVPAREYADVAGIRWARLAPFGAVRAAVAPADDSGYQFELKATGVVPPPDSDQALVEAGYAAITTIVGIAEAWPPERDDRETLEVGRWPIPGAQLEAVHEIPDASLPRYLHRPHGAPPDAR
jgi:5'-nucleotidase